MSKLESPPTTSPTNTGNTGSLYYPDYETAWPEAGCVNVLPVPSGRPTYTSQLACCKGAYGGQVSFLIEYQTLLPLFLVNRPSDSATTFQIRRSQDLGCLPEPARLAPNDVAHLNGRTGCILSRLRNGLGQSRVRQHSPHAVRSPCLLDDARLLQRRVCWTDERILPQSTGSAPYHESYFK